MRVHARARVSVGLCRAKKVFHVLKWFLLPNEWQSSSAFEENEHTQTAAQVCLRHR